MIGRLRLDARRPENAIAAHVLEQLGIEPLYRVQAPSPTVRVVDRVLLFEVAGLPLRVTLDSLMTGMQTMPMRTRREPHLRALALPARDSAEQVRGELIIFEALLQQTRDSMRVLRLDAVLLLR